MVGARVVAEKKIAYVDRVDQLINTFKRFIIFEADNVGATQLRRIKLSLDGKAEIIMGKNSLLKKAFAKNGNSLANVQKVLSQIVGNVGFLFTNGDLKECREALEVLSDKVSAKAGIIAQCDVFVPKGVTSISPEKTSFFQSLNISTMINKGSIEILSDIHLIKSGAKVGESEVTLLNMLHIKPFSYKMSSKIIYDEGALYAPSILDISSEDIIETVKEGIANVTGLSLAIGHTTKCSAKYAFSNAFRTLIGICLEYNIEDERAKAFTEGVQCAASAEVAAVDVVEEKPAAQPVSDEENEEASDEDFGLGIFG